MTRRSSFNCFFQYALPLLVEAFGLTGWEIEVNDSDLPPGTMAQVDLSCHSYRRAYIDIDSSQADSPRHVLELLFHEMLHVLYSDAALLQEVIGDEPVTQLIFAHVSERVVVNTERLEVMRKLANSIYRKVPAWAKRELSDYLSRTREETES